MNIHINDRNIFEELKRISVFNIEIGSKMYGTNNDESDTDILYIYIPSYDELNSISASYHQYQFKEDGIDHIFTDIYTFIKNSLNGDSTINFEVINNKKLVGSELEWLYNNKGIFRNYKILRAYLGRARKDLKQISSKSEMKDMTKKLSHAIRGYNFANDILENKFSSEIDMRETGFGSTLKKARQITDTKELYRIAKEYDTLISILRDQVNYKLDTNQLDMEIYVGKLEIVYLDGLLSSFVENKRKQLGNCNYYNSLRMIVAQAISEGIDYGDSTYTVR